jgi:hypothetical protein
MSSNLEPLGECPFMTRVGKGRYRGVCQVGRLLKFEPIMRRWKTDDKELVIEVLSERADDM